MRPPGLRISSGSLRGRKLEVPATIRPTEQKVREALFSIWGERVPEANLLDLFAGSGAVAIEAVSRGALSVTLVEDDRSVFEALRRNVALLPAGSFELVLQAVERFLQVGGKRAREAEGEYDLVFADPPYAWIPDGRFFVGCAARLRPGGLLTVEHSSRVMLPSETAGFVRTDSRRYGESALSFYGRSEGTG